MPEPGQGRPALAESESLSTAAANGVETAQAGGPDLLIVDDDPLITETLGFVLQRDFRVHTAGSRPRARALLEHLGRVPPLALVDLGLPPTPHRPDEGLRLISELLALAPDTRIVVLSGQNDEAHARRARALGAVDFIAKPCEPATLKQRLLEAGRFRADADPDPSGLVGESPPMARLRESIRQVAASPFPVLVTGESGTGKELVARAIHAGSARAGGPWFSLNCASISPGLVEPTLFGHARGAFTGATGARPGYFEEAGDGTLFLDEIGELPLELQAKLLRVLEDGEYQRVGETQARTSRARIIAATNRDLRQAVREGGFRLDLYHRLTVFAVAVPPLRALGDDRLRLFDHFARRYARLAGVDPCVLGPEARTAWLEYAFPGNVRELRNMAIRLVTRHPGETLSADTVRAEMDAEAEPVRRGDEPWADGPAITPEAARAILEARGAVALDQVLREWERCFVTAALDLTGGNLAQAARLLGMHRTTLQSRLQSRQGESGRAPGG